MAKDKLKELRELRERAGIKFDKSFRCKDAEKNVHLFDEQKFFQKIKERLWDMGYSCSDDFEFGAIISKFRYTERHHVGNSYRWKYFYSSTFTIEQELIDYLIRHNFIFPKVLPKEIKPIPKKIEIKPSKKKSIEEQIAEQEERVERYKQHIINFEEKIKEYKKLNDAEFVKKYFGAKKKHEEKLLIAIKKLEELKTKREISAEDAND